MAAVKEEGWTFLVDGMNQLAEAQDRVRELEKTGAELLNERDDIISGLRAELDEAIGALNAVSAPLPPLVSAAISASQSAPGAKDD